MEGWREGGREGEGRRHRGGCKKKLKIDQDTAWMYPWGSYRQ